MQRSFTTALGAISLLLCASHGAQADWVAGRRVYVNPDTGTEGSGSSGVKIQVGGAGGTQVIGTLRLDLGSSTVAPSPRATGNSLALTSQGRQYWVWQGGATYVVDTTVAISRNITGSESATSGAGGYAESQSLDLSDNTLAYYPHQYARPISSDDANPVYSKFTLNKSVQEGDQFYASAPLYAYSTCSRGYRHPPTGDSNATSRAWVTFNISSFTYNP